MKSGATESSFYYLSQYYTFPENVDVRRTTHEIIKSDKQYKVIWAHDNCDQAGHRDLPQHIDKIDKIVCVSNWEKEQYIKYNRAPAEKLTVIPNGVDDMFRPSGKPKSKTCIFFSAPHKGITPLVPIWKEVIKHHPDAKLKVFSSMSLYGAIQPGEGENETITTDKGLEPSPFIPIYKELQALPGVEYSPCIDREELLPHIQDAAFYIHPNVWEETFCVSLAEAMSCGCFPITTDMGALPETSNGMGKYIPMSGQNTPRGWITDNTFHQNFAEEIIRALHFFDVAKNEYEQASSAISKFAIETYNWRRVSKLWENEINKIIHKVDIFDGRNMTLQDYYEWSSNVNMVPAKHIDYLYQLKYKHNFEPKVVYDLGSAVLHWSKFASCIWNEAEFYQIDGFDGYETLYQKNNLNYAIEVLSNTEKEVTFYENLKSVGSCSYYEMNYQEFPYNLEFKNSPYYRERKVRTKSLDAVVAERNWKLPDLIKMDIQGCEMDVLKGAERTLEHCNHLILELQSTEYMKGAPLNQEVIEYLENKGYTLVSHFTQNPSCADGDYHFFRMNLIEATPFNPYIKELGDNNHPYAKCIKNAFERAVEEDTKLPDWVLSMWGMSGRRYRIFINNLIETFNTPKYLEIGSWSGSTVCSAVYGNKVHSTCIDNWSQFGNVRNEFVKNIQNVLENNSDSHIKLYEDDFRKINYNNIDKFNVYFFDGPHEVKDQYDGVKYALPALDDIFILIVDDWNDPRPREGTKKAIKDLGIEVVYSMEIRTTDGIDKVYPEVELQDSHWHNGYFISVCKKIKK